MRQPAWRALLNRLGGDKRVTRFLPSERPDSAAFFVTAERLPEFSAVHPGAVSTPFVETPAGYAKTWSRDEALVEIVRGRLEGLGPTTAAELAVPIAVPMADIDRALLALEAEGFVMRGSFTADAAPRNGASADCWRASPATRSSACARRSNRSPPPTSCVSCSTGSASRNAWKARMRWLRWCRSSKASRPRPLRGKPSCSRRVSPVTSRTGSTICAARGAWHGLGSTRRGSIRSAATDRVRCGAPRSP